MKRFFAAASEYDLGPEISREAWMDLFPGGRWCEDEDGTLIFDCVLADGRRFTRVRPPGESYSVVYVKQQKESDNRT